MGLYSFKLLINLKNIMIFTIYRFMDEYDDPTVAYVIYEDLNRFPKWQELKKEQDSYGNTFYEEEDFANDILYNYIKISVFFNDKKIMENEDMRGDITELALDLIHDRFELTTSMEVYLIDEDSKEYIRESEDEDYIISFIRNTKKYIIDENNLEELEKLIKDKTELDLSHLTQD